MSHVLFKDKEDGLFSHRSHCGSRRKLAHVSAQAGNEINIGASEYCWDDTDWIHLGQVRDKWWAVMSTIMNLQVSQNIGNLLSS
jgi:hypothetical protein